MKGDLIERDDVLKEIWEWIANREYQYTNATHWLQKRIEAIPSAKDKADRKTENNSEKPNNCEDESQIDNLATAIANEAYCRTCKHLLDEDCDCDIVFTGYEPKDEPQTDWKDQMWKEACREEADRLLETQMEDEPQTEREGE